ncbi:MAG: hypothetical protein LBV09_07315, partial [Deferribacteraceae bacterium]|nr:hypothetical protein [Deferribacteraceae bacterium]
MIAIDSSALITFFKDSEHYVTKEVDRLLKDSSIVLPPVVLAELLSDPALPDELARLLSDLITLQITDGYWQRVGRL